MFFKNMRLDIAAAKQNDPAARNKFEIWLTYAGVKALSWHRAARFSPHAPKIARAYALAVRALADRDRNTPRRQDRGGVFIDHGAGVVIGETAEVETGVVIYQGVTLGGSGKEEGKRHPTIKKGTVIGAGAKILGGFTVGEYSKIGAGAVVLKEVPPHATVVGVPGKVVRVADEKLPCDLKQDQCDPLMEEVCRLRDKVFKLEEELARMKQDEEKR